MKRRLAGLLAVSCLWWAALPALAHGLGGRQDLAVPLWLFVIGATVVLVVSFVALAVLWPTPRLAAGDPGSELDGRWRGAVNTSLSGLGLLALALTVVAGIVGADNSATNPASVLVFVYFWLVIPFLAAVIVDLYPVVNPWKLLLDWFGVGDRENHRGYEAAVFVFIAFTWLELVSPWQGPPVLAVVAVTYTVYLVVAGVMFGRSAVTESFDGFSVYTRMLGAMAPLAVDRDGRWFRRRWLRGLVSLPERTGVDLMAVAMIGTVTYDGAKGGDFWASRVTEPLLGILPAWSPRILDLFIGTVGLLGTVGLVMILYRAACAGAALLGGGKMTSAEVAVRFAHTLIPIAFAYALAHYFTLVLFEGQLLLSTISDPFALGWDIFGTADRPVDYRLLLNGAAWVWYLQVAIIVLGHVGGIVLAHDRALVDFGDRAVRTQYPMLALMVAFTSLGLALLAVR